MSEFVERRVGGMYYLTGSRVSLASIVYGFQDGESPETIQRNFPTLSLSQVYGAIAFYLGHPQETEAYLAELKRKWEELAHNAKSVDPDLQTRIDEARARLLSSSR